MHLVHENDTILSGGIMKRILTIAVAALFLILPVCADSDFGMFGVTGGYTSKDNTALMGFNGTYQYTADISNSIGIGVGSHADFSFGLNHSDELTLFSGVLCGLGIDVSFTDSASLNLTVGPVLAVEAGVKTASVGIGVGADAAFSYYFDNEKTVGITAGATIYPQFLVLDDGRSDNFSIAAVGYIGMSFRYPSPLAILAVPVFDYLLY